MSFLRRFFGGREIPDTTPVQVPLRFASTGGDNLHARILEVVRSQNWAERQQAAGDETFDDFLDFDVDDPDDRLSSAELFDARQDELRNAVIDKQELMEERRLRQHFERMHHGKASSGSGNRGTRQAEKRDFDSRSDSDDSRRSRPSSRQSAKDGDEGVQ